MLNKANRLTKRGSFTYVYRKGDKYSVHCLSLTVVRGIKTPRVGFVVSNKLGKAVKRNLVKRRLRAAMREMVGQTTGGQIVFVASAGICELDYAQILSRMTELLRRGGLLKS